MNFIVLSVLLLIASIIGFDNAEASHNPNLIVSAENPMFENRFSGSMVVEIIVRDSNISSLDKSVGEPDVTLNGNKVRMVQATDGNWYAYFANVNKAKIADGISDNNGLGVDGKGLDFGVFCGKGTSATVLGVSFSSTEGVAIPHAVGITGATDGTSSFISCSGALTPSTSLNNVVRQPPSINTNSKVSAGQIGLNANAWPVVQLFSFDKVVIKYNRAGGTQSVSLDYDGIPNILLNLDRTNYPKSAEVFVKIMDAQLNQDPTDEDSWTFKISPTNALFYQAFDNSGSNSANGGSGLINLNSHLSNLGFEKNGILSLNLGSIAELRTNTHQPTSTVSDGTTTFNQIVTFVESESNSGVFESFDSSGRSNIGVLNTAPRGQTVVISYNDKSYSIVSGSTTAKISLGIQTAQFNAGQKAAVTLTDADQNLNPLSKNDLNVYTSNATIPSLKIGNPVTLEKASSVKFYEFATTSLALGTSVTSSVPDEISSRLIIDTTGTASTNFDKISFDIGITANDLKSLLLDVSSSGTQGTNWLNYDLRSFEKQLDVNDFSDTNMTLFFGSLSDTSPVTIVDKGDISGGKGLVRIDDADVLEINSKSGQVFFAINFDSSNDAASAGSITSETDKQPIVVDLFSFGEKSNKQVNNAIYRFELKETSNNSGNFVGTIEFVVTNQLNQFNPDLIQTLRTIDDDIKFLVNERLINEKGISIGYSDLARVGVNIGISSKTDIKTHSGQAFMDAKTYRFGQPVIITLNDPDLNLKHDVIDSYFVIDDPSSSNVDAVGTSSGDILLEIKIKDFRYKRCTISGVEYGGLALTGFTLVETGPDTGIFKGSFKMPSKICNKAGTALISSAGGSLDAKYFDFRDSLGKQNIFSASTISKNLAQKGITPTINGNTFVVPKTGQTSEVIITGKISNYQQGIPVQLVLIGPDGASKPFNAFPTKNGDYKAVLTISSKSLSGLYSVDVSYKNSSIGGVSFHVVKHMVPDWIKNNAKWWGEGLVGDDDFVKGMEFLINEKIISISAKPTSGTISSEIPTWIRNNAKWYGNGLISSDDFVNGIQYLLENGILKIK